MHGPPKQLCSQASEEVIQSLSDFKLKLAGDSFLNDVWTSDVPIKSEIYFQSKTELDADCRSFRNMKDLLKVVKSLNHALSQKVSQMSDALLPPSRHHGLASIPNEIFIRIIDYAAISCTGYRTIMRLLKNLSSVSRRFRAGVISTTSPWNYWHNAYCLDDGFRHRLARTEKAPIFLDLFVGSRTSMMKEILKRILPHASRCHHLTLCAPWELEDDFFAEWMFPNMSSVNLTGALPPPGIFPNVTSLTVCNKGGQFIPANDYFPKLMSLLRSNPGLTELDLDVSLVTRYRWSVNVSVVELPSVNTFKIGHYRDLPPTNGVDDDCTSIGTVGKFISVLKLPNVESISIGLAFGDFEDDRSLSTVFSEGATYNAVTDFHLSVMSICENEYELSFENFSTHFPNLRSLRMERFVSEADTIRPGSFHLAESFDPFDGRFPQLCSCDVIGIKNTSKW